MTIFCNLKGGLGNMMFQIAATEALSLDLETNSSFPNFYNNLHYLKTQREYNYSEISDEYISVIKNINTFHPNQQLEKYTFPFEYVKLSTNLKDFWVDGYFQSEKYFAHRKDNILQMFKAPENLQIYIRNKYKDYLIQKTTSVHVRRGDYVKLSQYHTVLPLEYYNDCMQQLDAETDVFLVFSDDIDWCKTNMQSSKCVFIENEKDYIEMYLMSYCNNNITANSSFSWWGAWLNENKHKIVYGPSPNMWFGPNFKSLNASDIIPDGWRKV